MVLKHKPVVIGLITIVLLTVLYLGFESGVTGEAFQMAPRTAKVAVKAPSTNIVAKIPIHTLQLGCFIKIGNEDIFLTAESTNCKNLFIASKYAKREDFYRLLKYFKYDVNKNKILNANAPKVYYRGEDGVSDYQTVEEKFESDKCEDLTYFGIKLKCFNAISGGTKKNNLPYVITYLTTLRYLNKEIENTMLGKTVRPFGLMKEYVKFICDGTISTSCATDIVCKSESSAVYNNNDLKPEEKGRMKLCPKMLTPKALKEKKVHYTAVLYHEVNHHFDMKSHNYMNYDTIGHMCCPRDKTCNGKCCESENEKACGNGKCCPNNCEGKRDVDFQTVFGEHINFLFEISKNKKLSCLERNYAFDRAVWEMGEHLCQDPIPYHSNKPDCAIEMGIYQPPTFADIDLY